MTTVGTNVFTHPDEKAFEAEWAGAGERMDAFRAHEAEQETRIDLWRVQEYHNWLRWRICRKGFDWSKPGVIGLLALGLVR